MEPELLKDLASRLVAGEELTADDEESLLDELERQPDVREAILADEAVDTLLRALVRLPQTREDFVRTTVGRVAAVPPAPAIYSVVTRRPTRHVRKTRAVSWAIAAVCVAVVLLAGVSLWPLVHRRAVETPENPPPLADHKPKPPAPSVVEHPLHVAEKGFARLVKTDGAVWETPRAEGDRLAAGTLRLARGTAELRFDKGTVARVTGPAVLDLTSGDEVYLRRGQLIARVPTAAVGFTVITPVSRVVDLGTEFDVRVGDRGATDTVVRQGRVVLRPQREGEKAAKAVELAAGGLDRASVSLPDVAGPLLPVSTTASGSQGRFLGLVSVGDKTVEFHTPEAFREFQTSVIRQLRDSPEQFRQQWSMSVHASGHGAKASAWIEIDGQRHQVEISGDDAEPSPSSPAAPPETRDRPPANHRDTRQLLRQQLEESREENADNPAIQKVIDDMLKQLDDM